MLYPDLSATEWGLVLQALQPGRDGNLAMERLLQACLPGMRAHLLHKWRVDGDQAEDLLQEFILEKVLEQHLLARADRERGSRFRSFLLTTLDNFVFNQLRKGRAIGRHLRGMCVEPATTWEAGEDAPDPLSVRHVLEEALAHMHHECRVKARMDIWEVFLRRVVGPIMCGARPESYGELSRRLGYPRGPLQARMVLATGKRMIRREIRQVMDRLSTNGQEGTACRDFFAAICGGRDL